MNKFTTNTITTTLKAALTVALLSTPTVSYSGDVSMLILPPATGVIVYTDTLDDKVIVVYSEDDQSRDTLCATYGDFSNIITYVDKDGDSTQYMCVE